MFDAMSELAASRVGYFMDLAKEAEDRIMDEQQKNEFTFKNLKEAAHWQKANNHWTGLIYGGFPVGGSQRLVVVLADNGCPLLKEIVGKLDIDRADGISRGNATNRRLREEALISPPSSPSPAPSPPEQASS